MYSTISRAKNWEWPNCEQPGLLSNMECVATDTGQGMQD